MLIDRLIRTSVCSSLLEDTQRLCYNANIQLLLEWSQHNLNLNSFKIQYHPVDFLFISHDIKKSISPIGNDVPVSAPFSFPGYGIVRMSLCKVNELKQKELEIEAWNSVVTSQLVVVFSYFTFRPYRKKNSFIV